MAKVFSDSSEAIIISDADNRIIMANRAFTTLTGYAAEEAIGRDPKFLSAGKTSLEVYRQMWLDIERDGRWQGELWDRRKSGEAYPKRLSISVARDRAGKVVNYIGSFVDITERKAAEDRVRHLAHYDSLTDLPNRFNLNERLGYALGFSRRHGKRLALMLIDLDRFKVINDTLGHDVGDQLLIQVARRLSDAVGVGDFVARIGGDEFVVVLPGIDVGEEAAQVADKIVRVVSQPYVINGREQRTSPSIGICVFPDDAREISDLIKNADVAMYHAKANGRRNFQFFKEEMNVVANRRMVIEAEMRVALERRQFVLHYQPQIEVAGGRLIGFEALVRWVHPEKGMIPPAEFIAIAEETGLIIPLGDWVLDEACRQLRQWQERGDHGVRVSVNLSPVQFKDANLAARIAAILADTAIDPACLDLEVTESMAMGSPEDTIVTMNALRDIGVSLSIDDFGTGYSSLAYLKLFPIHTLKIDRSFVKDIDHDANDAAICDTIVSLAHHLGLTVIAEGVESEIQMEFLRRAGCEMVQGYLISKPLPAELAGSFARVWRARADGNVGDAATAHVSAGLAGPAADQGQPGDCAAASGGDAPAAVDPRRQRDALTGLGNRPLLVDRLRQAIAHTTGQGNGFALLAIDVDDFKPINDRHGRRCGDWLLCEIGRRLQDCTGNNDTVARIGGDEFAVLLWDVSSKTQAIACAQRIVAAVAAPMQADDYRGAVGVSIGIGLFPFDGLDCESLLQRADGALQRAKRLGKNRFYCAECAYEGRCDNALCNVGAVPASHPAKGFAPAIH
jgi:diguanylate cyclase (GGDEF)-like protein/PAS domain S-box-containing protein